MCPLTNFFITVLSIFIFKFSLFKEPKREIMYKDHQSRRLNLQPPMNHIERKYGDHELLDHKKNKNNKLSRISQTRLHTCTPISQQLNLVKK